jgi:hypothetical protein
MRPLCKDWWVLFAGDDISPIFDIVDYAKRYIEDPERGNVKAGQPASLYVAQKSIKTAFEEKRMEMAESLFLRPTDWDIKRFNTEGSVKLPNFKEMQAEIRGYELEIELLVAGFEDGKACIFTLNGYGENRGLTNRSDIPGFDSIGSGSVAAMYMMFYRDLSPKTTVRESVYYALEAKYFGEQASGVGESTDLFVARPGKKLLQLNDEETIEKKLIPICYALSPNLMRKRDRETLNSLSELKEFPLVEEPKKKTKPKPKKKPQPSPMPKAKIKKKTP